MSDTVFTNPASRSADMADAYVRAVTELVGDQDPFQILQNTPDTLKRVTEELSQQAMTTPEAPGKWSVFQVLWHLADSELVWGYRIRMILVQERPPLTGYDQDAWADRLRYAQSSVEEANRVFSVLRAGNLRLLRGASAQDLERVGVHSERGEESLEDMIPLYAGHDLVHLRQIERIRKAIPG